MLPNLKPGSGVRIRRNHRKVPRRVDEYQKVLARFSMSGARKKVFKIIRGLEVINLSRRVSVEGAIEIYLQDPDVLYAEPNYILKTTNTSNDPRFEDFTMLPLDLPSKWVTPIPLTRRLTSASYSTTARI